MNGQRPPFSKSVRKALDSLGTLAYDRELGRLLGKLDGKFARWREGEIPSVELGEALRRFVRGRAWRDLEGRYGSRELPPFSVARAMLMGILRPEEVPAEVSEALEWQLTVLRRGLEDGSVSFDSTEE